MGSYLFTVAWAIEIVTKYESYQKLNSSNNKGLDDDEDIQFVLIYTARYVLYFTRASVFYRSEVWRASLFSTLREQGRLLLWQVKSYHIISYHISPYRLHENNSTWDCSQDTQALPFFHQGALRILFIILASPCIVLNLVCTFFSFMYFNERFSFFFSFNF